MNYATIPTPHGPFTVIIDADEIVLVSGFTVDTGALLPLVHPELRPTGSLRERPELGEVTRAVVRYFDGELMALDKIEVRQRGGEFMSVAWDTLRTVKFPVTYADFAALAGRPTAVRAAAQACARNAAALFVPCHRVLRAGGALGGFRWGLEVKKQLLDHEAAIG